MRGLAISLVVLGHTNQGIAHRGWWGNSSVGAQLQAFIYAFHMPAFFFVSGVFLTKSVEKRGELRFTLGKLRTVLYPYVLWTFLYLLASVLFSRFMVQAIPTWQSFSYNLLTGYGGWFLPALFFCLMLGMLGRKLPRPLLFLVSILAFFFLPASSISFIDRGVRELPFLTLGMWVGVASLRLEALPRGLAVSSGMTLACVLLAGTVGWSAEPPIGFLAFGILGTAMLLLVARALGRSALARALAWIGQASFGVFLIAPFPQGASRAVLQALHVTAPVVHLVVSTLLAVLIPAWVYHLAQHQSEHLNRHQSSRLRLGWLFVSPW